MAGEGVTAAELAAYTCNCEAEESVVSRTAYLADLLEYATDDGSGSGHVTGPDGVVSIDDLEETFHQPFGDIAADPESARETVRYVRICVEALLGYLEDGDGPGLPPVSETEAYRTAAYEALLDSWGVTRDDLRTAAYDEQERGWVAEAVGVPEWVVPDLWLDPDAPPARQYDDIPRQPETSLFDSTEKTFPPSEANLEDLFGLPAVTEPGDSGQVRSDPLRTTEEPYVRRWRTRHLRNEWFETDHPSDPYPVHLHENTPYANQEIDSESTRPIVDPDLIGPGDFRVIPEGRTFSRRDAFPDDDEAFALWETRRQWLDGQLESIWKKLPVKPNDSDDVRAVLNGMLDPVSYAGRSGESVWYPGRTNKPSTVPANPSPGSTSDGPFAGSGFLEDVGRLYRQLTGDAATAETARNRREKSTFPTGDPEDSPADAARSVIEEELHLGERSFRRLVELLEQYYAEDGHLDEEEWWEVASILAGARKRSLFGVWTDEETNTKDVHLDRTTFWQPQREPGRGEWSLRLDSHDPLDPDDDPEPYIDPERMDRSELPERPRGDRAHELYEKRQRQLRDKRETFAETFRTERLTLQSEFEALRQTHDKKHATLTSKSPVPDGESTIDSILDAEYASVSWPKQDWELRFSWVHEGLQLAQKGSQGRSTLSGAEKRQVRNVEAKLEDLQLSADEFRRLHRLRKRATLSGPDDKGLSPEELADVFALLPRGNPLDPVLTAAYRPSQSNKHLKPVYDGKHQHWDPLFDEIAAKLEGRGSNTASGASSAPAELAALGLTADEFESVLSLRRRARPGPDDDSPPEPLVSEVIRLLTSAWKRSKHYTKGRDSWLTLERDRNDFDDYWDARKARLPAWRATPEERARWQRALYRRSSAPIVDPDLIEGVDDFQTPAWERDAFDLWTDRKKFLFGSGGSGLVSEIEQLRADAEQGNHKLTASKASQARSDVDAALERTLGVALSDLRTIAAEMERGDDVGVRLTRLDLTPQGLSHVLDVDDALGTQPVRVTEWESLKNVLLRAWKHRQYGRWNREERAFAVTLEPRQFDLPDPDDDRGPPDEDDPLRWRVDWSVRTQWEDVLETRVDQREAVDEEIEEAVATAESEALPVLRDSLVERADTGGLQVGPRSGPGVSTGSDDRKAEWLSERLLVDTEMYGGKKTTRTTQAVTSLQNLLKSLDLDLDERDSGLGDAALSLEDPEFDRRWQWLGTYEKWNAAIGVYLYPENVLLPTLRRRTTETFDRIAGQLSRNRDLTAARIHEAAQAYREYLEDVMALDPVTGCMAPRAEAIDGHGTLPSDGEMLAYVFAESKASGTYYFEAVDPTGGSQRHQTSTWTAIPVKETGAVSTVHGATYYQESVYLFVSTSSGGERGNEGAPDADDGGTSERETEIQYLRYDIPEDTWQSPQGVELPDEIENAGIAGGDTLELTEVENAEVVITEGRVRPPELVVDLGLKGSRWSSEQVARLHVQFERSGSVPGTDEYVFLEVGHSPLLGAFDFARDVRALFSTERYAAYDLGRDGARISLKKTDTLIDSGTVENVIYRPAEQQVMMVKDNSSVVWLTVQSGRDVVSDYKYAGSATDRTLQDMFQCNNITPPPGGDPNRAGEKSVQENVLIGRGSPWGGFRSASSMVPVPVTMDVKMDVARQGYNSRFVGRPDVPLVPAFTRVAAGDISRTGLYPPRLEGVDDLSAYLADQADNARKVRTATHASNAVYVAEAYYYLPLYFARQLTQAGEYEEALRWFRTVYDFTASGESSDPRAVWPELQPDPPGGRSDPGTEWLLDPIDPHAVAETRSNPYTKFTLFSLVRCLSEYADDEFAIDTPRSVADATTLYEQALDLLEADVLHRDEDPCQQLVSRLNTQIRTHVVEQELWTGRPSLSREEVEAKTDELVRTVEDIDDYTDRRNAVSAVETHLESGELHRALDAAKEWHASDQERSPFDERLTPVVAAMGETAAGTLATDRAAVAVASEMRAGESDQGDPSSDPEERELSRRGVLENVGDLSADNIDAAGAHGLPLGMEVSETPESEWVPVTGTPSSGGAVDTDSTGAGASDGRFERERESDGRSGEDVQFLDGDGETEPADPGPDFGEGASATVDAATMDVLEATKHEFCVPENPLLTSLRRHAEVNLEKIRSGRNIAGMKRNLEPAAGEADIESAVPTSRGRVSAGDGGTQPTDYRYETLLERAKELADQARQFENELLTAIEKAEREEYKLKKARQQVELAEQRVSLQETRMERAREKVELARRRREKATIRRQKYRQWLKHPLVEGERKAIDSLSVAEVLQHTAAGLQLTAAFLHRAAGAGYAMAAAIPSTTDPGVMIARASSAVSSFATAQSTRAGALSTEAGALSTKAQIQQIKARKQRRKRRWKLKKQIADQNYEVGTQRIAVARDTVDIVSQEREIAQLRADHAADIVNFHENKFTDEKLYQWIADVLEGVYRYFLQQAAAVGKMAQRQLAFKRQGLPREFVQSDYWEAPTRGQTAVPASGDGQSGAADRRGMTGSARLLQDIYELDQHEFRTDQRRLQAEKTLSVAALDPVALQQFRETGVLSFATTLADFDVDHPGHYHRLVEDVDVRVVALTPPTEGINATLTNSGTSRVVVGDTLFREETIDRDPERVVLDRAGGTGRDREVRLRPRDREMLRPFEHSGVATDWELTMPRPANDMDYSTIVDVEVTVEYSALQSDDYRQQVIAELDTERTVERSYSFHDDFGDAWYELVNAPAGADATTVRFDTEREDFPSNLTDLSLEQVRLYFVVTGPDRDDERENLEDLKVEFGPADGSTTENRATSGTVDVGSPGPGDVDQEWELTVTPTAVDNLFADGTVEDILLVATAEGDVPNWPP